MLDWHFAIPIAWALIAVVVALALYKTSSALFEQTDISKNQVRRVRFIGSITIAGAVFIGLKWATPAALLEAVPEDSILIRRKVPRMKRSRTPKICLIEP